MNRRVALVPALACSLVMVASGIVVGQTENLPVSEEAGGSALPALCAANAADEDDLTRCLEVVRLILAPAGELVPTEESDARAQALGIIDEAVAAAEGLDVQAAIDQALAAAGDVDVQGAIDEALVAAGEVDVQAVIDEALAAARDVDVQGAIDQALAAAGDVDVQGAIDQALAAAGEVDVQGAIDEALAASGDVDVQGAIDEGVEVTRNVVAAAEIWAAENAVTVCRGGSVSMGVGAAAVVGFLTGSPGLAFRAFEEAEKATIRVCIDAAL